MLHAPRIGAKIFLLTSLAIIWLGLMGLPKQLSDVAFLLATSILSYCFALKLKIVPKKLQVNLRLISYFLWLIKEIIKSTIGIIKIVWRRELNLNPDFAWIDSNQINDLGLVIYGSSITLTPGTFTLDIQNNKLLIHALDKSSINDLRSGEMDQRIKKVVC